MGVGRGAGVRRGAGAAAAPLPLLLPRPLAPLLALLPVAAGLVTRLEAWGDNAIRVRVAAPGQADVSEPPIVALQGTAGEAASATLTRGNLRVDLDPDTALLTATRVSDGATLLEQTALEWGDATREAGPLEPACRARACRPRARVRRGVTSWAWRVHRVVSLQGGGLREINSFRERDE